MSSAFRPSLPLALPLALVLGLSHPSGTRAQFSGLPGAEPASATRPPAPRSRAATPIPAASIAQRASEAESRIAASTDALQRTADLAVVRARLPRVLSELASLEVRDRGDELGLDERELRDGIARRLALEDRVGEMRMRLRRRARAIEHEQASLAALRATWNLTAQALARDPAAPRSAIERVREIDTRIARADALLSRSTDELVETQAALDEASEGVDIAVARLRSLEARSLERLFERVGPPLLTALAHARDREGRIAPLRATPRRYAEDLGYFLDVYGERLPWGIGLALVLSLAAVLVSRRTLARPRTHDSSVDPLLEHPLSGTLLVVSVAARFLFPRATYVFFDSITLLGLIPLVRLLPSLVPTRTFLRPLQGALFLFGLHRAFMLVDFDEPWKQLGILVLGLLFLADVVWILKSRSADPRGGASRLERAVPGFARLTAVGLVVATVAGLSGRSLLAYYLVDGLLIATYWLFVCIVMTKVALVFVFAVLASPRVAGLSSMTTHGELIQGRIVTAVELFALLLWLFAATLVFGVYDQLSRGFSRALEAHFSLGTWTVSLEAVLAFGLTLYISAKLARFVGFFVELDVLPRLDLPRGAAPTTARLVRYAILLFGFIFAVGASGLDPQRFALVVSALGVGIGFGLQNVVNNFVSGLMLIFERPVRVGDTVEIGGLTGEVRQIGIRASTIRTYQGAEVIVPNGELISKQVINWTLTDQHRRVDVPIGVAYGSEPAHVLAILEEAARTVRDVAASPAPVVLFVGFGDSALNFEVRIWVRRVDIWPAVRSEANFAIHEALSRAGIEIPFPQRDLHLRSVEDGVVEKLQERREGARPSSSSS